MATCLSVVVARGFGFISVQLIASLLADHCTPMISGYVVLVICKIAIIIDILIEIAHIHTYLFNNMHFVFQLDWQ